MLYLQGIAWLGDGGCVCFVSKWVCVTRTCLILFLLWVSSLILDMGIILETCYVRHWAILLCNTTLNLPEMQLWVVCLQASVSFWQYIL